MSVARPPVTLMPRSSPVRPPPVGSGPARHRLTLTRGPGPAGPTSEGEQAALPCLQEEEKVVGLSHFILFYLINQCFLDISARR